MGLDLSLEGLVFRHVPQLIFQVPRRDWFFQLLESLLDPVLGLVGWAGHDPHDPHAAPVHRNVPHACAQLCPGSWLLAQGWGWAVPGK